MSLANVGTYTLRGEAEVARARLNAADIDAMVIVENEGGLNPGFYRDYGVRVVVDEGQLVEARRLLGILPLDPQVVAAVRQHARFCAPDEACGLLAMDALGDVRMVYCCTNVDRSPSRFTVAPEEHFRAICHAEGNGWEIGGSFHSHPKADARPSSTDVDLWPEPMWVQLIVGGDGEVRGYRLVDGRPQELMIEPSR